MTRRRPLLGLLLVAAAVLVSSCAAKAQGPDVTTALTGTPFCQGIRQFRTATDALNSSTLTSDPNLFEQELAAAHDQVLKLQNDSPPTPLLKDDLTTVADGFVTEYQALQAAKGDPQQIIAAATRLAQDPTSPGTASADLNNYGHKQCGFNTEGNPTATTAPPPSSGGPATTAGPTAGPARPPCTIG